MPDATSPQEKFLNNLKQFIEGSTYYLNNEGTLASLPNTDTETYTISDPDGEYEEIKVRIILKS